MDGYKKKNQTGQIEHNKLSVYFVLFFIKKNYFVSNKYSFWYSVIKNFSAIGMIGTKNKK